MKGFSKSITNRFQPLWKVQNQTGNGYKLPNEQQSREYQANEYHLEKTYEPIVDTEKSKKRSKKHKKRKREYQNLDY